MAKAAVSRRAPAIEIVVKPSSGSIKLPAGATVDVTPQALCMSSPFNSSYWLAVA